MNSAMELGDPRRDIELKGYGQTQGEIANLNGEISNLSFLIFVIAGAECAAVVAVSVGTFQDAFLLAWYVG